MINPGTTYRIQFHKGFTFKDFEAVLPYLIKLGITTIYASPIFEAVPGSVHGYDVTNPLKINPEIGTEEELRNISSKLKENNINWLQDIVPNHMAFHCKNEWLMDVLEKGQQSTYASFFDIAWNSNLFEGKLMVPFLGSSLEEVINKGELKLFFEDNRFILKYYDSSYPLNLRSYLTILETPEESNDAIHQLIQQLEQLHDVEEPIMYSSRWSEAMIQLAAAFKNEEVGAVLHKAIAIINADQGLLKNIADEQVYRLCHWQETDQHINYRRFFTVNGLICLNIHDKNVFQQHHQLVKKFISEGIFQGLRVDHIDGLFDPATYLNELRSLAGDEAYIIVEKILEVEETLPIHWPLQGTSGYEFLAQVNNLFTNKQSEESFTKFYQQLVNDRTTIEHQIHDKKAHILYQHMGGELENLYQLLLQLNLLEKKQLASVHPDDLKTVIGEFLIYCPVYRFYGNSFPLNAVESGEVQKILQQVNKTSESPEAVQLMERILIHRPQEGNEEYNRNVTHFYQRCMQFSGPLMAKGVEDTLMYTYNRFIGHNEVGDAPGSFGFTPGEFHQLMKDRQQNWPLSLNGTSTHDTKRGEDVRARLNVITDIPDEWFEVVEEWKNLNKELKSNGSPDVNDEYLIYQALLGSYPLDKNEEEGFEERFLNYLEKALREAKRHSNWTTPDTEYEGGVKAFVSGLLNKERPFWNSFQSFLEKLNDHAVINSLSQVLLKFTCPGVPDIYQGCEMWDFSLVDPDNRRVINYEKRQKILDAITSKSEGIEYGTLWQDYDNGDIKLWLLHLLTSLRKEHLQLFTEGDYVPLSIEGSYKKHVLAFARKHGQNMLVVAIPLHTAILQKEQNVDVLHLDWKDTRITLPKEIEEDVEDLITGTTYKKGKGLELNQHFNQHPFIILKSRQRVSNARGAGILLHITSLPSPFGIGDLGPEAKAFADFLKRSRQKYWQLLPLNPTEGGQGYSPYSAISSRAGYPLLISLELLAKDGLLDADEVQSNSLSREARTNFEEAERIKTELLSKAFETFKLKPSSEQEPFKAFCEKEKDWLNDFALYSFLKNKYGGKPWYEWDDKYKLRDNTTLEELETIEKDALNKIKWLQFIFFSQWRELKKYCNNRNIQLIGDLPFYISYDSSDVWSNKEIFALNEKGERTGLAGVPPDAFSSDGQLWGMPVFKWDVLEASGFQWWIERVQKNKELFDIVRIDHFRAFADYWEVPAGEETAKNGQWKKGPGAAFFKAIENALGELPFVAEDLGEVDDTVFELRDQFNLPGMKILQFAFGEDMPASGYIPHNYTSNFIVYTGTHDNNTTKGWYRTEADEKTKGKLQQYTGRSISEEDAHLVLSRLAYSSIAKMVILPIQDILGLDEASRMNIPASAENNWNWRLVPGQLTTTVERQLQEWTWLYNRE